MKISVYSKIMSKDFKQKKAKSKELGIMISLTPSVCHSKGAEIGVIKDRLDFKLKQLEEKGLDEKIKAMEKVLEIIHEKI